MRSKFLTVANVFSVYREDGGSRFFRNASAYPPNDTASPSGRYIHFESVKMKRVDIKIVKVSRDLCKYEPINYCKNSTKPKESRFYFITQCSDVHQGN
jgi:hypothetical protein